LKYSLDIKQHSIPFLFLDDKIKWPNVLWWKFKDIFTWQPYWMLDCKKMMSKLFWWPFKSIHICFWSDFQYGHHRNSYSVSDQLNIKKSFLRNNLGIWTLTVKWWPTCTWHLWNLVLWWLGNVNFIINAIVVLFAKKFNNVGNIVIIHVQSAPKTTSPMPQSSKN
jgi:hypothetical protein